MKRIILRGDLYYAYLSPVVGSEQGGNRPVVILQNDLGNRYSPTVIVAAITGRKKIKLPTHVTLDDVSNLERDSMVLLEQLRTIDKRRLKDYLGALDEATMKEIDKSLSVSIGLKKRKDTPLLLCLCSTCASQFYNNPEYFVHRLDQEQKEKELCMYCNIRRGYDYCIRKK